MTSPSEQNDRFSRQADLVPQAGLEGVKVSVIGVGAVGRQVALQLAAIGVREMQLVDFDLVELTNVTTQGYYASDVGRPKVEPTRTVIKQIDDSISVQMIYDRYSSKLKLGQAVFCCVDSISTRSAIWRSAGPRCRFWSDGRMLAEVIRILTVADEYGRDHYPTTLFPQAEAEAGRCTARSTIYAANVTAALMVHQFTRWLRKLPIDVDLGINLLASEMTVVTGT